MGYPAKPGFPDTNPGSRPLQDPHPAARAGPAVNLRPTERTRAAQRRSRLRLAGSAVLASRPLVAGLPAAGPATPATATAEGVSNIFSPVFRWVVVLEEFGEISGTPAWLFCSKTTLKFSLSPLSLTRQGAIM